MARSATDPAIDRLRAIDATFLHVEGPDLPMHVASVATFEAGPLLDPAGQLRIDDLRAQVASRMDTLPRLRKRLAWTPLGLTRPCWVDDVHFDVANHVDTVELPPGAGPDGLRHLAEGLIARPLPRNRPLWHLCFVTGLEHDRVGLVERVHHALVDGVSGVDVATVLLDLTPEVQPPHPSYWEPSPHAAPESRLLDGLRAQARLPFDLARAGLRAVAHPIRVGRQAAETATAVATVVMDGVVAPSSPLNRPTGHRRQLAWITTHLDDVKQAGRTHGATANDVVLSAAAEGLRSLHLVRGEIVASDAILKVFVPVSLRDDAQRGTLGNQVGGLLLRLPIGIADPVERLRAIADTTARLKRRREAATSDLLMAVADILPAPITERLTRFGDRQRVVNLVVTNVPGPPVPLYCLGARMLDVFPVVPLGPNLPVGLAVLSYDGALNIGITADPGQVPDLDVITGGIEAALATLGAKWSPPRAAVLTLTD